MQVTLGPSFDLGTDARRYCHLAENVAVPGGLGRGVVVALGVKLNLDLRV